MKRYFKHTSNEKLIYQYKKGSLRQLPSAKHELQREIEYRKTHGLMKASAGKHKR